MQKKKYGFTLIELLITLAIAAIVTTMGFTIAKHSVQKAYEGYFYQGYTTLNKLLAEASYKDATKYTLGSQEFYDDIASKYLSLKDGSTSWHFTTTSGIEYGHFTGAMWYMVVPQARSSEFQNGRATVYFRYRPAVTPYLVPDITLNQRQGVDLGNRVDLLVCYINDGIQGTVNQCASGEDANGNPIYTDCGGAQDAYTPPIYMSLRQALCTTIEDATIRQNALRCDDEPAVAFDSTKANMAIKFVHPRKAHL